MRRYAGIVFLRLGLRSSVLLALSGYSQDIPVGTWRTHFSYNSAELLEKTSDKIFCAAENGLFSVDLSDHSIRKLSKIDGLSDVGISALRFDPSANVLAVGYRSGLVDFISESTISTLTEVALSNLDGDKKINDIKFLESRWFLASGLGIVVVSNDPLTIRENFVQIGVGGAEVQVSEIEIVGEVLFAKTNLGLQNGNLSDNLLDFNNWTHHAGTANLHDLAVVGNEIFARVDLDLYQFSNNTWTDTGVDLPGNVNGLHANEGKLLTVSDQSIFEFTGSQFDIIRTIAATLVNDLEIVNGAYWLADGSMGLLDDAGVSLSPAGPLSDQYSQVRVVNNSTYGFHAPPPMSYDGGEKIDGYSVFSDGQWSIDQIPNFRNVSDVTQYQGVLYFSSIGDGLYNQSDNQIITDIPQSDASLDTVIATLSSRQELWVSSFSNTNPVHRLEGDQWSSFTSSLLLEDQFTSLSISELGILWGQTYNGRVIVFDPVETRVLSLGSLPGQLEDFEISIEDDVWIATSGGPATYSDASFIFESNEPILPSFEGRVLFENEQINAIETDGGNRVWFGTDRGLWVFNENTSEQIAHFNINNSPIPSNRVLNLAYNGNNGEMFINTEKGMISYRSASSVGSRLHQNVNIFPNPVSPDYSGLVGIEGLAKNTSIKITDINGALVKELEANGSSASWDLKTVANKQVVTGVYLIFSSTSNGVETYVGKIAVIR